MKLTLGQGWTLSHRDGLVLEGSLIADAKGQGNPRRKPVSHFAFFRVRVKPNRASTTNRHK